MLRTEDGIVPRFDNFFVEVPGAGGLRGMEGLVRKITGTAGSLPLEYIAPPGRIKFWDCLPTHLRRQYSASRFTDSSAAFEVINEPRVHVDSPGPEANQDTGISARV